MAKFETNPRMEPLSVTEDRWKLFDTPELGALAKIEAALLRGARTFFFGTGLHRNNRT